MSGIFTAAAAKCLGGLFIVARSPKRREREWISGACENADCAREEVEIYGGTSSLLLPSFLLGVVYRNRLKMVHRLREEEARTRESRNLETTL